MSNFDCVGFRADSQEELVELMERVLPLAEGRGKGRRGTEMYAWEDGSGARLVFDVRRNVVQNMLPSFAGATRTQLGSVRALNDDTSIADVVDDNNETITRLAVDLEQRALIAGMTVSGPAALVALVGEVSVHADAEAFGASPESFLGSPDDAGPPPAHFVDRGLTWPPRMASESFISQGAFGETVDAQPIARLNGVVVSADERTNTLTGAIFVRARVRTAGFEVDVCAPRSQLALPTPGQVLAGMVYMVGSMSAWTIAEQPHAVWRNTFRNLARRGR